MRYIELKITTDKDGLEAVENALIGRGFTSMQIDGPADAADIAEHPEVYKYDYINDEILRKAGGAGEKACPVITIYFNDDGEGYASLELAKKTVREIAETGIRAEMSASPTGDDSEWLYKWQEHFRPAKIGRRIVVKPSWEDYAPGAEDLVIEMDPGMAFGSGLHATTSMCVKALEEVFESGIARDAGRPLKVLDVGTGTGILAMASVLLGAGEAFGIDIDEEAVRVSGENIARNGLCGRIRVAQGDLMAGVDYRPDIIVANLMADLVMMLSPAAASQLDPGGIYITSGILDIKEEIIKKTIEDTGFDIIKVLADGEWRAIMAVRR